MQIARSSTIDVLAVQHVAVLLSVYPAHAVYERSVGCTIVFELDRVVTSSYSNYYVPAACVQVQGTHQAH
jgi:hypothetical protein